LNLNNAWSDSEVEFQCQTWVKLGDSGKKAKNLKHSYPDKYQGEIMQLKGDNIKLGLLKA